MLKMHRIWNRGFRLRGFGLQKLFFLAEKVIDELG